METIDGRACVVISGNRTPYSYVETLWLDPQRDFLAVRVQTTAWDALRRSISLTKRINRMAGFRPSGSGLPKGGHHW